MKANRWSLAVLAVLAVLGALPTTAKAQCPVGAMGGDATSFALRLKDGESRRALVTSDQTTTQTVMGQEQNAHEVTKMRIRYDVLEQGEDGQRRVRITYESIQMESTTPMMSFTWDSSDTTKSVPQGAAVFAALLGQSYTVAMSPDGSERHVEGWDSLVTHLMDALPLPPGGDAADMREMVKKNVGESIIGGAMSDAVSVMPAEVGAVGDSWSCTSHTGGNLSLVNEATWTVDSRSGGVSTLKVTSTMKSDSTASMSMGPMTVRYALTGTTTGTMDVEDATGWILRSHSESDMSGTATMEGSPMGPMEIPMTTKVITTTEPVTGG